MGSKSSACTINVSRRYNSTVSRAYQAWTEPDILTQWFGPPGYTATVIEHDLRVDGSWKFRMTDSLGNHYHHFGTFIEIKPNKRLVFTWASEEQVEGWRDEHGNPTIVTVEFLSKDNGIEVSIIHENLVSATAIDALTYGWNGSLDCLMESLTPADWDSL